MPDNAIVNYYKLHFFNNFRSKQAARHTRVPSSKDRRNDYHTNVLLDFELTVVDTRMSLLYTLLCSLTSSSKIRNCSDSTDQSQGKGCERAAVFLSAYHNAPAYIMTERGLMPGRGCRHRRGCLGQRALLCTEDIHLKEERCFVRRVNLGSTRLPVQEKNKKES